MVRILLISLALSSIAGATGTNQSNDVCIPMWPTAMRCRIPGDDGRSFMDVIGNKNTVFLEKLFFLDIRVHRSVGFGDNPFALFPNLRVLQIWKEPSRDDKQSAALSLPAAAFRPTPMLKRISMGNSVLSDSTIQALASLKHQVERAHFANLQPETRILTELANFTELRELSVNGMCNNRTFPTGIFQKSAPTLEVIEITSCSLPKFTKYLFSAMPNLDKLQWVGSNVTEIEPKSFDANPKITSINLSENKIRCLPAGLFNSSKNLTMVDFSGNEVQVTATIAGRNNFIYGDVPLTSITYQACMP